MSVNDTSGKYLPLGIDHLGALNSYLRTLMGSPSL